MVAQTAAATNRKQKQRTIPVATMTTSQTIHDNLLALSQKGNKKKNQETKTKKQGKSAAARRIVELAKVVFVAPRVGDKVAAADVATTTTTKAVEQADPSKDKPSSQSDADDQSKLPFQHYRNMQQQLAQELQQMEQRRKDVLQKQTELWDVYKFGLEKISNLNDLRDAPDAILPGNFPPPPGSNIQEQPQHVAAMPQQPTAGTSEEFSARI